MAGDLTTLHPGPSPVSGNVSLLRSPHVPVRPQSVETHADNFSGCDHILSALQRLLVSSQENAGNVPESVNLELHLVNTHARNAASVRQYVVCQMVIKCPREN